MNITYVCADRGIPLLGDKGASVHLRSLAAALVARGNTVTVACRRQEGNNPAPAGVGLEVLPADEVGQRDSLVDMLRRTRSDVVLERYSLSSTAGLDAARTCRLPFVLEMNAPLVDEAAQYRGLEDVELWRSRERRLLEAVDRVIAVSEAIRDHAILQGAAPERVTVVHNGVDLGLFNSGGRDEIRRRYGLGDAVVIGFVGSLKPWHGVARLIEALRRLPVGTRLLIVGDGPERGSLESDIASRGLTERVVMTGTLAHAEVAAHLAAMDIAIAPYRPQPHFYFSPLKVVEYMAAGVPVIASSQGDLPEIVGNAGLLVRADSSDALVTAIRRLIGDPVLRDRMSRAGRARAAEMTWDRVAAQVQDICTVSRELV